MNEQLREFYLDWVNNYLTVEKLAEHYELDVSHARTLIDIGRDAHQQYIEDTIAEQDEAQREEELEDLLDLLGFDD